MRIILGYRRHSIDNEFNLARPALVPVPLGWPSATLVSATLVRLSWRCTHGTEAAAAALSLRVTAARESVLR